MRNLVWFIIACVPVFAQPQTREVTVADYQRAEKFLAPNLTPLVVGGSVAARWVERDRFWYRSTTAAGPRYVFIDPKNRTRAPYTPSAADTAGLERPRG